MTTGPWHFVMFGHWRGGLQLHSVRDARMGSLPEAAQSYLGLSNIRPNKQRKSAMAAGPRICGALCTLHFQLSKLFCFGTENVNHPMAVGSSYRLCGHPERSVFKYLPASHEISLLGPLIFENRTPIWTSPNTANTLVSCFTW
jgi:hypothetical protein